LLKAEGKPVKDHPVKKQLVHLRLMLDKMKPIGAKLKYQIDKLLKKNTNAASLGLASDVNVEDLKYKPRPDLLAPKDETGSGLITSKEEIGIKYKPGKEDDDLEGIYRPPKINPTTFETQEKESEKKEERKRKKHEKKPKKVKILLTGEIKYWKDQRSKEPEEWLK